MGKMPKKRIRTHVNPLSFHIKMEPLNLDALFSDSTLPLCLEIGCGKGVFLRHYAQMHPEHNIIGVEVRKQIVDWLEERLSPLELGNAMVQHGSAERCLDDQIADDSLSKIFVFHPDPWIKDRHQKRRVIRPEVIMQMAQKLKKGGRLYIATDVESLWDDIRDKMAMSNPFKPCEEPEFWEKDYTSHWSEFSKRDGRRNFFATYTRV